MSGLNAVPPRTFTDGQDLTRRTGCLHLAVVFLLAGDNETMRQIVDTMFYIVPGTNFQSVTRARSDTPKTNWSRPLP